MKKIAIIVKRGIVDSVYVSKDFPETEIEIIDMDVTDCRDAKRASFRKKKAKIQLTQIY